MSYRFEARDISVSFGPVKALADVTVGIAPGEVHAIIGENGAGKSTLMNVMCGRLAPGGGTLLRDGNPVRFRSTLDAQGAGVAIAPQEISLVPALSVAENIALGAHSLSRVGQVDWKATIERASRHIARLDEGIDPLVPVGQLSKAQQQMVQIARALGTEADILIFDEPTAALTDQDAARLFEFIRRFKDEGRSVFYISHRLDEVLSLSDRITVLRDGRLVAELDPRHTDKTEMIRHMAGRDVTFAARKVRDISDEIVLRVSGLTRAHEFSDVSFDLRRGEILGIAGLVGSGRTELGRCIFGKTRPDSGSMELFGKPHRPTHPADSIARGLVYLPEERKQDGIFPLLSIAENIALPSQRRFQRMLRLRFPQMVEEVSDFVRRVGIKVGALSDPITTLSGGNQQKAILARWLMRRSMVLFLDEPTRGIDVKAKSEIQALLAELAAGGMSIIYVSSELQEVIDVSDRILVMHDSEVKGITQAADVTQESLLHMAMS